ncbi:response regulator transcription factor [Occallatibacter riparius]|uniref:Response regulator n=1 Tax=Occallatibacter riparius TaxID=1002689 RepID=A0A9J7BM12_9BACT|nr:response regulator [Occallatibacter riparius]UWZ83529.1 response regulator [Occallatibacter riparius]
MDDEHSVADTLGMIVQAKGHTVRVAYSGVQAAGLVEAFKPHAVISDLMMPGMDGFELAEWIEQRHPEARILFISADFNLIEEARRIAPGGRPRNALPKPVLPTDILRFLDACAVGAVL